MSSNDKNFDLFIPTISRNKDIKIAENYLNQTLALVTASLSSSFEDTLNTSALTNTQQIPLDFSKFENHTFFNSAESNVNTAFEKIINKFPFDGSSEEHSGFNKNLSGFEKYILSSFPKSKNFLWFSGSYIEVIDVAGSKFPTLSKDKSGKSILDPGEKSFTAEMQLFVPTMNSATSSIVFQKTSGSNGISLIISSSFNAGSTALPPTASILFAVNSGSNSLTASANFPTGKFSHLGAVWNRQRGNNILQLFNNGILVATSSKTEIKNIDFATSSLYLGTGSIFLLKDKNYTLPPLVPFSGAIDEFRIFHKAVPAKEQDKFRTQNISTSPDLKLYFKFNEPTGSYSGNNVVLDSSGNSLHSTINGFGATLRNYEFEKDKISNPMILESKKKNPILFPDYPDVISLNTRLLSSASIYDANNPNLITKLVPRHYLLEASSMEGFEDEDARVGVGLSAEQDFPGAAKIGSPQILASLLFLYGKYFDELKIFIDHFSKLDKTSYLKDGNISSNFLEFYAKQYGLNLPPLYTLASLSQYIDAKNLGINSALSDKSLQEIQHDLWRRILTTLPQVLKSKGTRNSINYFLNALGMESGKIFKVREFGGRILKSINTSKITSVKSMKFLDFSGSLGGTDNNVNLYDFSFAKDRPVIRSSYLSGSRTAPGIPSPAGTVNRHGSTDQSDGLFTSSSFTIEGIFNFSNLPTGSHFLTQSLMRLESSGTLINAHAAKLFSNIVALAPVAKENSTGSLRAFANDQRVPGNPFDIGAMDLNLSGVNIFDGNNWHVSFGRKNINMYSASYFLTAKKVGDENDAVRSVFKTGGRIQSKGFNRISSDRNQYGTFMCIGSQSIAKSNNKWFLNGKNGFSSLARATAFSGKVSQLRFWSKALTANEIETHANDPFSLGVENPNLNFCFGTYLSGSFERNKVDFSMQQPITSTNTLGEITLFNFSQLEESGSGRTTPWSKTPDTDVAKTQVTKFYMSGTGFEKNVTVLKRSEVVCVAFSPTFDLNTGDNKIYIDKLNDSKLANSRSQVSQ